MQKQRFRGVLRKIYSENMQQIYRRTRMNNFIEITLRHGCSVNLLHIFRTPFPKNTSRWLLLKIVSKRCLFEVTTSFSRTISNSIRKKTDFNNVIDSLAYHNHILNVKLFFYQLLGSECLYFKSY